MIEGHGRGQSSAWRVSNNDGAHSTEAVADETECAKACATRCQVRVLLERPLPGVRRMASG